MTASCTAPGRSSRTSSRPATVTSSNVSSLYGLLASPGQSAYNAAKFAVRGFTEALRQEMIAGRSARCR